MSSHHLWPCCWAGGGPHNGAELYLHIWHIHRYCKGCVYRISVSLLQWFGRFIIANAVLRFDVVYMVHKFTRIKGNRWIIDAVMVSDIQEPCTASLRCMIICLDHPTYEVKSALGDFICYLRLLAVVWTCFIEVFVHVLSTLWIHSNLAGSIQLGGLILYSSSIPIEQNRKIERGLHWISNFPGKILEFCLNNGVSLHVMKFFTWCMSHSCCWSLMLFFVFF